MFWLRIPGPRRELSEKPEDMLDICLEHRSRTATRTTSTTSSDGKAPEDMQEPWNREAQPTWLAEQVFLEDW